MIGSNIGRKAKSTALKIFIFNLLGKFTKILYKFLKTQCTSAYPEVVSVVSILVSMLSFCCFVPQIKLPKKKKKKTRKRKRKHNSQHNLEKNCDVTEHETWKCIIKEIKLTLFFQKDNFITRRAWVMPKTFEKAKNKQKLVPLIHLRTASSVFP